MSYWELASHAAYIETTAVATDLEKRGYFQDAAGGWHPAHGRASAATAVAEATARYAGAADLFTPFLGMPDGGFFSPAVEALSAAAQQLNQGAPPAGVDIGDMAPNPDLVDRFAEIHTLIQHWRGPAAENFRQNYLGTFRTITTNQFMMTIALRGAMEAEGALWRAARDSVDEIAHAAMKQLDDLRRSEPSSAAFLLTVAGAVLTVTAALVGLPQVGALEVSLIIAGEGSSAAASAVSGQITGSTPADIIEEMRTALEDLAAEILDRERAIARAMTSAHDLLVTYKELFVAPAPALASVTAATATGPDGLGPPIG